MNLVAHTSTRINYHNPLLAAGFCERGLQAGARACEAKDVRLLAACKLPEKTCR
jgi:hypothetical protein